MTSSRILTRAIVFLLLGAIVSVAVTWAVAWWAHPYMRRPWRSYVQTSVFVPETSGQFTGREYDLSVFRGPGGICVLRQDLGLMIEEDFHRDLANRIRQGRAVESATLPEWLQVNVTSGRTGQFMRSREDAFGWPVLALSCHYETQWSPFSTKVDRLCDGIAIPRAPKPGVASSPFPMSLPLRPIWPGFVFNTLFYTTILWLLAAAPFALRRHLRIKRGQCINCGYPVGTSDRCTECGASVRRNED